MGARMFTALIPPVEVVEELDRLLEPRREAAAELRWTRPDGWHLTTAFMGDVPDALLDRLEEGLDDLAATVAAFRVGLSGGVAFPDVSRPKLLAMAVVTGHDKLRDLSGGCRRAATKAGVVVDGAKFVGHLTLARSGRPFSAARWFEVLGSFPEWTWEATELCLVESIQVGRRYVVRERFAFGGDASRALD